MEIEDKTIETEINTSNNTQEQSDKSFNPYDYILAGNSVSTLKTYGEDKLGYKADWGNGVDEYLDNTKNTLVQDLIKKDPNNREILKQKLELDKTAYEKGMWKQTPLTPGLLIDNSATRLMQKWWGIPKEFIAPKFQAEIKHDPTISYNGDGTITEVKTPREVVNYTNVFKDVDNTWKPVEHKGIGDFVIEQGDGINDPFYYQRKLKPGEYANAENIYSAYGGKLNTEGVGFSRMVNAVLSGTAGMTAKAIGGTADVLGDIFGDSDKIGSTDIFGASLTNWANSTFQRNRDEQLGYLDDWHSFLYTTVEGLGQVGGMVAIGAGAGALSMRLGLTAGAEASASARIASIVGREAGLITGALQAGAMQREQMKAQGFDEYQSALAFWGYAASGYAVERFVGPNNWSKAIGKLSGNDKLLKAAVSESVETVIKDAGFIKNLPKWAVDSKMGSIGYKMKDALVKFNDTKAGSVVTEMFSETFEERAQATTDSLVGEAFNVFAKNHNSGMSLMVNSVALQKATETYDAYKGYTFDKTNPEERTGDKGRYKDLYFVADKNGNRTYLPREEWEAKKSEFETSKDIIENRKLLIDPTVEFDWLNEGVPAGVAAGVFALFGGANVKTQQNKNEAMSKLAADVIRDPRKLDTISNEFDKLVQNGKIYSDNVDANGEIITNDKKAETKTANQIAKEQFIGEVKNLVDVAKSYGLKDDISLQVMSGTNTDLLKETVKIVGEKTTKEARITTIDKLKAEGKSTPEIDKEVEGLKEDILRLNDELENYIKPQSAYSPKINSKDSQGNDVEIDNPLYKNSKRSLKSNESISKLAIVNEMAKEEYEKRLVNLSNKEKNSSTKLQEIKNMSLVSATAQYENLNKGFLELHSAYNTAVAEDINERNTRYNTKLDKFNTEGDSLINIGNLNEIKQNALKGEFDNILDNLSKTINSINEFAALDNTEVQSKVQESLKIIGDINSSINTEDLYLESADMDDNIVLYSNQLNQIQEQLDSINSGVIPEGITNVEETINQLNQSASELVNKREELVKKKDTLIDTANNLDKISSEISSKLSESSKITPSIKLQQGKLTDIQKIDILKNKFTVRKDLNATLATVETELTKIEAAIKENKIDNPSLVQRTLAGAEVILKETEHYIDFNSKYHTQGLLNKSDVAESSDLYGKDDVQLSENVRKEMEDYISELKSRLTIAQTDAKRAEFNRDRNQLNTQIHLLFKDFTGLNYINDILGKELTDDVKVKLSSIIENVNIVLGFTKTDKSTALDAFNHFKNYYLNDIKLDETKITELNNKLIELNRLIIKGIDTISGSNIDKALNTFHQNEFVKVNKSIQLLKDFKEGLVVDHSISDKLSGEILDLADIKSDVFKGTMLTLLRRWSKLNKIDSKGNKIGIYDIVNAYKSVLETREKASADKIYTSSYEQMNNFTHALEFLINDNTDGDILDASVSNVVMNALYMRGYAGAGKSTQMLTDILSTYTNLVGGPIKVKFVAPQNRLSKEHQSTADSINNSLFDGNGNPIKIIEPEFITIEEYNDDKTDSSDIVIIDEITVLNDSEKTSIFNKIKRSDKSKFLLIGDDSQVSELKTDSWLMPFDKEYIIERTIPIQEVYRTGLTTLISYSDAYRSIFNSAIAFNRMNTKTRIEFDTKDLYPQMEHKLDINGNLYSGALYMNNRQEMIEEFKREIKAVREKNGGVLKESDDVVMIVATVFEKEQLLKEIGPGYEDNILVSESKAGYRQDSISGLKALSVFILSNPENVLVSYDTPLELNEANQYFKDRLILVSQLFLTMGTRTKLRMRLFANKSNDEINRINKRVELSEVLSGEKEVKKSLEGEGIVSDEANIYNRQKRIDMLTKVIDNNPLNKQPKETSNKSTSTNDTLNSTAESEAIDKDSINKGKLVINELSKKATKEIKKAEKDNLPVEHLSDNLFELKETSKSEVEMQYVSIMKDVLVLSLNKDKTSPAYKKKLKTLEVELSTIIYDLIQSETNPNGFINNTDNLTNEELAENYIYSVIRYNNSNMEMIALKNDESIIIQPSFITDDKTKQFNPTILKVVGLTKSGNPIVDIIEITPSGNMTLDSMSLTKLGAYTYELNKLGIIVNKFTGYAITNASDDYRTVDVNRVEVLREDIIPYIKKSIIDTGIYDANTHTDRLSEIESLSSYYQESYIEDYNYIARETFIPEASSGDIFIGEDGYNKMVNYIFQKEGEVYIQLKDLNTQIEESVPYKEFKSSYKNINVLKSDYVASSALNFVNNGIAYSSSLYYAKDKVASLDKNKLFDYEANNILRLRAQLSNSLKGLSVNKVFIQDYYGLNNKNENTVFEFAVLNVLTPTSLKQLIDNNKQVIIETLGLSKDAQYYEIEIAIKENGIDIISMDSVPAKTYGVKLTLNEIKLSDKSIIDHKSNAKEDLYKNENDTYNTYLFNQVKELDSNGVSASVMGYNGKTIGKQYKIADASNRVIKQSDSYRTFSDIEAELNKQGWELKGELKTETIDSRKRIVGVFINKYTNSSVNIAFDNSRIDILSKEGKDFIDTLNNDLAGLKIVANEEINNTDKNAERNFIRLLNESLFVQFLTNNKRLLERISGTIIRGDIRIGDVLDIKPGKVIIKGGLSKKANTTSNVMSNASDVLKAIESHLGLVSGQNIKEELKNPAFYPLHDNNTKTINKSRIGGRIERINEHNVGIFKDESKEIISDIEIDSFEIKANPGLMDSETTISEAEQNNITALEEARRPADSSTLDNHYLKSSYDISKLVPIEEVIEDIRTILGEKVVSTLIKENVDLNALNAVVWGKIKAHEISLYQEEGLTNKYVGRHESMHYIMLHLLSNDQLNKIKQEIIAELKSKGIKNISDIDIFEYAADEFMTGDYNKPTTLLGKALKFIKEILNKLGLYSFNLNDMFNSADSGYYSNASLVNSSTDISIDNGLLMTDKIDNIKNEEILKGHQSFLELAKGNIALVNIAKRLVLEVVTSKYEFSNNIKNNSPIEDIIRDYKTYLKKNFTPDTEIDFHALSDASKKGKITLKQVNADFFLNMHSSKQLNAFDSIIKYHLTNGENFQYIVNSLFPSLNTRKASNFNDNDETNPNDALNDMHKFALASIRVNDIAISKDGVISSKNTTNQFVFANRASDYLHEAMQRLKEQSKEITIEEWANELSLMVSEAPNGYIKNIIGSIYLKIFDTSTPVNILPDGTITGSYYGYINKYKNDKSFRDLLDEQGYNENGFNKFESYQSLFSKVKITYSSYSFNDITNAKATVFNGNSWVKISHAVKKGSNSQAMIMKESYSNKYIDDKGNVSDEAKEIFNIEDFDIKSNKLQSNKDGLYHKSKLVFNRDTRTKIAISNEDFNNILSFAGIEIATKDGSLSEVKKLEILEGIYYMTLGMRMNNVFEISEVEKQDGEGLSIIKSTVKNKYKDSNEAKFKETEDLRSKLNAYYNKNYMKADDRLEDVDNALSNRVRWNLYRPEHFTFFKILSTAQRLSNGANMSTIKNIDKKNVWKFRQVSYLSRIFEAGKSPLNNIGFEIKSMSRFDGIKGKGDFATYSSRRIGISDLSNTVIGNFYNSVRSGIDSLYVFGNNKADKKAPVSFEVSQNMITIEDKKVSFNSTYSDELSRIFDSAIQEKKEAEAFVKSNFNEFGITTSKQLITELNKVNANPELVRQARYLLTETYHYSIKDRVFSLGNIFTMKFSDGDIINSKNIDAYNKIKNQDSKSKTEFFKGLFNSQYNEFVSMIQKNNVKLNEKIVKEFGIDLTSAEMNPFLLAMISTHYIVNKNIDTETRGGEYYSSNVSKYIKRGAGEIAPYMQFDRESTFGIGQSFKAIVTTDIKFRNDFYADKIASGELRLNNPLDGVIDTAPWFDLQMVYSSGGNVSDIVLGGAKKTVLFNYNKQGKRLTYLKSTFNPIDEYSIKNSKEIQEKLKMMLGEYADVYFDSLIKNFNKTVKDIVRDIAMDDINNRGTLNEDGTPYILMRDRLSSAIVYESSYKIGLTGVNDTFKIDESTENDFNSYAMNNPMTIDIDTTNLGLQQILSHDVESSKKSVPSQFLSFMSKESVNTFLIDEIDNVIKKYNFNDFRGHISRQIKSSAISRQDNRLLDFINTDGIRLESNLDKLSSSTVSALNTALKPDVNGFSGTQQINRANVYYKLDANGVPTEPMLASHFEDNKYDDSIDRQGYKKSLSKDMSVWKVVKTKSGLTYQEVMYSEINDKDNYIIRPADVVMDYPFKEDFGIDGSIKSIKQITMVNGTSMHIPFYITSDENKAEYLKRQLKGINAQSFINKVGSISVRENIIKRIEGPISENTLLDAIVDYYVNFDKSLDVAMVRIPFSSPASGTMGKIMEFSPNAQNTIYISPLVNDRTGADQDGDSLHTLYRTFKTTINPNIDVNDTEVYNREVSKVAKANRENTLFEEMLNFYKDTTKIDDWSMLVNTNTLESLAKAQPVTSNNIFHSLSTFIEQNMSQSAGQTMVGHFANMQTVLLSIKKLPLSVRETIFANENYVLLNTDNDKLYNQAKSAIQELVNAATDNSNLEGILGKLNINTATSPIIFGMILDGKSLSEIVNVLTSDYVKGLTTEYANNFLATSNVPFESKYTFYQFMKGKMKDRTNKTLQSIYDYALVGENLRRYTSLTSLMQEISASDIKLYQKIYNIEFALGMTMEDFLNNLDIIKLRASDPGSNIDSEYLKNYIGTYQAGKKEIVKQTERAIRATFDFANTIANNELHVAYIRAISHFKNMLSEESLVDNIMNDKGINIVNRFKLATGSLVLFDDHLEALRNGIEEHLLNKYMNSLGRVGKHDMAKNKDRMKLVNDMPGFFKQLKSKSNEKTSSFIDSLSIVHDRQTGLDLIEINGLQFKPIEEKNIIANSFKQLDEDTKKQFRAYQLITNGLYYSQGSLSDVLDLDNEKGYSNYLKRNKNKIFKKLSSKLESNNLIESIVVKNPNVLQFEQSKEDNRLAGKYYRKASANNSRSKVTYLNSRKKLYTIGTRYSSRFILDNDSDNIIYDSGQFPIVNKSLIKKLKTNLKIDNYRLPSNVYAESINTDGIGNRMYYEGDILPEENTVFVFGSNPIGINGKLGVNESEDSGGAAAVAQRYFNVEAKEIMDNTLSKNKMAYGLVTVTAPGQKKSKTPKEITDNIKILYKTAIDNPNKQFKIAFRNTSKVSLNGYTGFQLMEMFNKAGSAPENIIFSKEWILSGKLNNSDTSKIDDSKRNSIIREMVRQRELETFNLLESNTYYLSDGTEVHIVADSKDKNVVTLMLGKCSI